MRNEIYKVLGALGFGGACCAEDEKNLALWRSWYEGDVRHFHSYHVFNGQKRVLCRRYGLGMAKKICEDWANLLMNEHVRIRAGGKPEQAFLDRVLDENRFFLMANRLQESKAALGTAAYIPRMTKGRLRIDYLDAEGIFPLRWENGLVTACAFASPLQEGDAELQATISRISSFPRRGTGSCSFLCRRRRAVPASPGRSAPGGGNALSSWTG